MASPGTASFFGRALSASLAVTFLCALFPSAVSAAGKPDLTIVRISQVPAEMVADDSFNVTSTTKNKSSMKAARTTTRYYLSANTDRDAGDTRLGGTHAVPALGAGKSSEASVTLTVPMTVEAGDYRLLACADDKRKVGESNEKNNCKAGSTTIAIHAASSEALIDAALQSGELDAETALEYKVFSLFDDPRLPAEFKGDDSLQRSEALIEAATSWESLSIEAQAVLQPFLIPPYYGGSFWQPTPLDTKTPAHATATSPWCLGTFEVVTEDWDSLETANGKVRVWWQKRYDATDQLLAQQMVYSLETKIYPAVTGLMGREPKGDDATSSCDGGSAALDIALVDTGTATTIPDSGCANTSTHMVFPRAGAGWAGPMPYLAHELMHAIQFNMTLGSGTICNEYAWMREGTAQWIQDYVTDASYGIGVAPDDTEFQAAPTFLDHTDISLEIVSPPQHHDYASYLFFFFLARQSSPAIVKDVWAAAQANNSLKAIEAATGGAEGLRVLWKQFALYNWNQGSTDHYKTWDGLTKTPALTADGSLPKGETEINVSVKHLSSKYLTFTPAEKLTTLEFTSEHPSIQGGGIQAVIKYKDGTDKVEDWSDEEMVDLCLQDPEVENVTLIFSNGNSDTSNAIDFEVKWKGRADLCCAADEAAPTGSMKRTAKGSQAAPVCPITGTITYTITTTSTDASQGCCPGTTETVAVVDVSMKDDGYGSGFVDDGSTYTISYTHSEAGSYFDCDYSKSLSGGGDGLIDVGAGKITEAGDPSFITGTAETRELIVAVERKPMDYTYSGSETYSGCANTSYNGTIQIGPFDTDTTAPYSVCDDQSVLGQYLEFVGESENSTTLHLSCSRTDGETTKTLEATLYLPG